ncbi:MAG TPA: hypothetical protein VE398_11335 [Acidobacteriota bacterium]|nr:hypothetical protein [Acidobacteriota bacterium]
MTEVKYDGPVPQGEDPTVPQITDVWGINSSGDMVGQLVYLKNREGWNSSHGWIYDRGERRFQFFDYPGGSWTIPVDINDRGDVVGSYQPDGQIEPGPTLGFLLEKDGSYRSIAVPPEWAAQTQQTTGINSEGVMIGMYTQEGLPHGYILYRDRFIAFDPPGAIGSLPYGINPAGVVVGIYLSADFAVHGYMRIPKH